MVGTRVGFAGGSTPEPDYRHPGDHAEAVEVVFDPKRISYEELLDVFWQSHPTWLDGGSSRVASGVLTTNHRQHQLALESRERYPGAKSSVARFWAFFPAERKHQKFDLQRVVPELVARLEDAMPEGVSFLSTPLASKMNSYLTGFGSRVAVIVAAEGAGIDPGPILELLDAKKIR